MIINLFLNSGIFEQLLYTSPITYHLGGWWLGMKDTSTESCPPSFSFFEYLILLHLFLRGLMSQGVGGGGGGVAGGVWWGSRSVCVGACGDRAESPIEGWHDGRGVDLLLLSASFQRHYQIPSSCLRVRLEGRRGGMRWGSFSPLGDRALLIVFRRGFGVGWGW